MSLSNPNKEERAWMTAITTLGCIACYLAGYPGTPGAVHHILRNGKRESHLMTICLCDPGHHQNGGKLKVSRHPNRVQFERAHGTENELLLKTRELVAQHGLIANCAGTIAKPAVATERAGNGTNRKLLSIDVNYSG